MPRQPWSVVQSLSFVDLLRHLGDIAPERVRLDPVPGRATEPDIERLDAHEDRLYELIDGVLVEKVYHFYDAVIATRVACPLGQWAYEHSAGIVTGASAPFRVGPRQVLMPDAAFTSWERLPGGRLPFRTKEMPTFAPDLAIEVLNPANTAGEMERKRRDYFAAGVRLVWYVDPRRQIVDIHSSANEKTTIGADGVLDGATVLPGFTLPVKDIFASRAPARKGKRKGSK